MPYAQEIIVGEHSLDSGRLVFSGTFAEIAYSNQGIGIAQMKQDAMRAYRGYGLDKMRLIAYFRDLKFETINNQNQNVSDSLTIVDTLTLEIWNDVAECIGVENSGVLDIAVMSGERVMEGLKGVSRYYGMGVAGVTDTRDSILMCFKGCDSECEGEIQVLAVGSPNTLSVNTVKSPRTLPKGYHYDICYKKIQPGTTSSYFTLPMGQIYIMLPIQYVYPFNRGIIQKIPMTFLAEGGDISAGDQLVFTSASECDLIDEPLTTFDKVIFTRSGDSTFTTVQLQVLLIIIYIVTMLESIKCAGDRPQSKT